ncbi:MAG TPA: hypothetical protein VK358_10860, partial [Longimicrobium sp.]|nr:hypothetical protein [Longimicrobium sp.]
MRNTILAGLALAALAAVPAAAAPAPLLVPEAPPLAAEATASPGLMLPAEAAALAGLAAQGGRVSVWLDGSRDLYRPGERIRARVRSDRDGYLAVFHIDT